ncbi:hypothetical protein TOPH_09209 [Tolypocladium ophioglossoides CBS 100239]|uniref:Protein kinase domain-containing protein n=1 Tax=Tolypocladium ophioglossoides (strain CBS 100239) TaxID=1163406 RepID=A0A0L0MWK4_TOLOC|nr:hypothetical protein TOPH_09209 [Tolypocladium ophioglossoides CBS 100239]
MDDIEELRRRLRKAESRAEEAERRGEEEQRRREEAERQREEEQRRRETAEELAATSRPQTLQQYLEASHSLNLGIQVITDPTLTTQGDTTNPVGRLFPRRIIPWHDFATKQEGVWDDLSIGNIFPLPAFPSQHQLEYVKSVLKPISSEVGLREFEQNVVEYAVQKLVARAYSDPLLRSRLGLRGTVTFESHTNLGTTDPISKPMENMSLAAPASAPRTPAAPKARRKARGKGNRADQFCIYRTDDGRNAPVLAIEYKAPHKLSVDEVVTGLESEIQPERDVINKHGEGFDFTARALAAAVITQLFSYMIGKGIQFGYVCTGETFIFLYIPDDPTAVYFSVCVPNLDVMDDDETRLHRTAVSQVFAFILHALRAKPPSETWHDKAQTLDLWDIEYDDFLSKIPASDRKRKEPRASPYKPQRWKGFMRSPIRTRSYCLNLDSNVGRPEDDDEDPPSPTPNPPRTRGKAASSIGTGSGVSKKPGRQGGKQQGSGQATKPNIQSRPFCTQQCLLGLAYGGPTDENCPNSDDHGQGHINRLEFIRLVRDQLATDRDHDADCAPLYLSGARGSLFKVRLSTHGYTLVAKGVEGLDLSCLQHENEIYNRLRAIQGKHIPVCLGSVDLVLPYYYDCGVYVHFMFLSWAGQPLFDFADQATKVKVGMDDAVTTIFKAMHKLGVLHRDAELRNILYNAESGRFMVVDFDRAEFRGRQHLGSIDPNGRNRKRKRRIPQKHEEDEFAKELESAVWRVSTWG